MKAKSNIPKEKSATPPDSHVERRETPKWNFPDYPVTPVDIAGLPEICSLEITGYLNALYCYNLARADFERRRAELAYKLTLGCDIDPKGKIAVKLDRDGRIVLSETCLTCGSEHDPY